VPPRVIRILTLLSQQKECAVLTRMKFYAVSPTPKERYSSDSLGVRMILHVFLHPSAGMPPQPQQKPCLVRFTR
jgi:hypothetical protein